MRTPQIRAALVPLFSCYLLIQLSSPAVAQTIVPGTGIIIEAVGDDFEHAPAGLRRRVLVRWEHR